MGRPELTRRALLRAGVGLVAASALPVTACGGRDVGDDQPSSSSVPRPSGVARSSWSTDPWAGGAYSFLPVGATPELRSALAEPIEDRLVFAGEALDLDAPSTVHGALASGRRAAAMLDEASGGPERIVVVGAGVAGAAAAASLARAGHDVVVVEARARVGGRIATIRPDGWPIPVELGASWIHDTSASALAAEAEALGIESVPFDYVDAILDRDGGRVDGRPAREAIDRAVAWAADQERDRSLAEAIEASGVAERSDRGAIDHALRTEITTEYGADADELSAWWALEEGSEGDDLLVVGGYDGIVEDLLEGIEVELDWPVSRIEVGSDVAVLGARGGERRADRVLVTVPLGVLQRGAIEFDPPLPDEHRRAIESLGMGALEKVWLRWDEPWWSEPAQQWTRMAPDDDPFIEWFNLAAVTDAPILLALIGGREARRWEAAGDEEVVAAALASLEVFRRAGF